MDNLYENTDRLIVMDEEGLHISSREIAEKLEKKNLSASMVTALTGETGCAARWLAQTFVVNELIEEEPDNAARRGSLFHKVMEDLFALEPEQRTQAAVKELTTQTLNSSDFIDLSQNKDVIDWLKNAINGYYNMGSDPMKVKVAEIVMEEGKDPKKGLEIFVKGQIGNTKREILGFIDRLVFSSKDDGSLIIEDWKSGTKSKHWKSHTKSEEGWAEQRQQLIYAMLLRQKGFTVVGARLLYPVAQDIVKVNVHNETMQEKVIQDIEETDKKLDVMIENNTFEYKPSFLCAWCPISKICPSAIIKPYAKMQESFANQPEPEVLLKGIELR